MHFEVHFFPKVSDAIFSLVVDSEDPFGVREDANWCLWLEVWWT